MKTFRTNSRHPKCLVRRVLELYIPQIPFMSIGIWMFRYRGTAWYCLRFKIRPLEAPLKAPVPRGVIHSSLHCIIISEVWGWKKDMWNPHQIDGVFDWKQTWFQIVISNTWISSILRWEFTGPPNWPLLVVLRKLRTTQCTQLLQKSKILISQGVRVRSL